MVLQVLLQRDILRQLVEVPVHAGADVAAAAGVLQHLGVFTLAAPHHRRHHLDAGTLRQGHDLVDDLVHRLLADLPAALGAVGHAHPRPQQAEVVIDLRHRAHGGAGVLAGGLLVDGDGRGQAVDIVHVGLVHLAQKHTGVGAEALHIPALAFGVDGIKRQRAFAAAAESRQHHQLVPGDGDVDIFQVVLAGALDENFLLHGIPLYTMISAVFARSRAMRSPGRHSTCAPIFPALTQTVSYCGAVAWNTVGNCFFMPTGLHPPWT